MARVHVHLDDDLLDALDRQVGPRERSSFIEDLVRRELDQRRRWELIRAAEGSITAEGHAWDPDPAAFFREQRRTEDERRAGRPRRTSTSRSS
jgi:Arc/MetJ family transcription regulator